MPAPLAIAGSNVIRVGGGMVLRRVSMGNALTGLGTGLKLMDLFEDDEGNVTKQFPGDTFNSILGTPGIKFFVNCDQDKPIAFRPHEIKKLFDMCDDAHLETKMNVEFDYQEGDILDVVDGPFAGQTAEVISIQGSKILGQLDMFGRIIPAEFTKEQVLKK